MFCCCGKDLEEQVAAPPPPRILKVQQMYTRQDSARKEESQKNMEGAAARMFQAQAPDNLICSISLDQTDKMRLIGVPEYLLVGFRQAVKNGWSKGIQEESFYHGVPEFKLRGNPWVGQNDEAVWSRGLLISVLTFMAQNGWTLLQTADVSIRQQSKDTLLFEHGPNDPEAQVFSISFNMPDKLRVIGAPSMVSIVKKAVQTHWKYGIQNEREYFGAFEIKLSGNPWSSYGSQYVYTRIMLNHILAEVRATGYKLYGSSELLNSWFLRKVGQVWH